MGAAVARGFLSAPADPLPAIDDTVLAAVRRGAWFAFNLSGGKDSTASAHAAIALLDALGHPRDRRIAIHADLGRAEWRSTPAMRSEEHTSELQSLMRISYAVFCLKKKHHKNT